MITVPELAADALSEFISRYLGSRFEFSDGQIVQLVPAIARLSLERIGNSDALYHNVEHTMLVTLAGHDIMRGRALHTHMTAKDYVHIIFACLAHDIGYVRGALVGDGPDGFVINGAGDRVKLPRGASDAALLPYHVDRSKLYALDRFKSFDFIDAERVARAIEGTRFPGDIGPDVDALDEDAAILRAADLIGQLGDPNYIRKANALYHEFEEAGINRQLGYDSPADLIHKYPQFYWNSIAPHVQTAIGYLNVTASGRQWIANLYANVFRAERDIVLSGPQT